MPEIRQRELGNQISDVLRRAEQGEHFTVTVGGRPVAELGPLSSSRTPAAPARLDELITAAPVDAAWANELKPLRDADEAPAPDPWAE